MDRPERQRGRRLGALFTGGAIALAGILASLALVYSNATGVNRVAIQSRIQQEAESALGTTAAARNAVGQTLILASSETVADEVSTAWIEQARLVLTDMERRVTIAGRASPNPEALANLLEEVLGTAHHTLDAVATGDIEGAGVMAAADLADAFEALTVELAHVRDQAALQIASADAKAGSTATASRFMVALFVPLGALGFGTIALRRRRKRERLAAELERERSISRSKDQLIANLSHELRTPLTGIYTSALAMEDAGFSDEALAGELNSLIIDQSADLTRMVEDLLVSAQAEAGRLAFAPEPTSLSVEVHAVVREFQRSDTSVGVRVEDAMVLIDPGRFRQLLRNLVSNAVRHGGPTIFVQGRPAFPGYLLQVVDDGEGVPSDLESRMFERFIHRGNKPLIVGSVGLGLAMTKVLVEGMNGTIAYGRHAEHTVFSIRLPLADHAESAATGEAA